MRKKRAVNYCTNPDCSEFTKKLFSFYHDRVFECNECFQEGGTQRERGFAENTQPLFKEVRVAYNFHPTLNTYRSIVVVRDESLWGHHNVYHHDCPVTVSEKRAFQIAEQILATLNQMSALPIGDELPDFFESCLSWDADLETFKQECENWGESMRGTPLTRSCS